MSYGEDSLVIEQIYYIMFVPDCQHTGKIHFEILSNIIDNSIILCYNKTVKYN